jgi:hypothetical protein
VALEVGIAGFSHTPSLRRSRMSKVLGPQRSRSESCSPYPKLRKVIVQEAPHSHMETRWYSILLEKGCAEKSCCNWGHSHCFNMPRHVIPVRVISAKKKVPASPSTLTDMPFVYELPIPTSDGVGFRRFG